MRTANLIVFPTIVSALGGAQSVQIGARFAWITTAEGERIRVALSRLPAREKWTAFNLADAARK